METIEKDIEIRSESVREILGRPPQWIISWGTTVVIIVIGGLVVGSYFFKYPQMIKAPIIVTTENLPANVMAKSSGRIDSLFVHEKQIVHKGQLLAVIDNPAGFSDIMWLMKRLDSFPQLFNTKVIPELSWPTNLELGSVQVGYGALLKSWVDYISFLKTDYYRKKIQVITNQIIVQQAMRRQSQIQLEIIQKQVEVAENLFRTDSILYTTGAISPMDFEIAKSTRLQALREYEHAKSDFEAQKMNLLQLEQALYDLEQQRMEQNSQLQLSVWVAYDQLQAQMKNWEQQYLLYSPVNGVVTLTRYWQTNQNIQMGETLLTIVPDGISKITGKIYLPTQGAGKVMVDQIVNVKLDNFPYIEFGILRVQIKNIALVPIMLNNERRYILEVVFPESLETSYGKILPFSQEMQGIAEIITDDLRLIDKFLKPIKALWNR